MSQQARLSILFGWPAVLDLDVGPPHALSIYNPDTGRLELVAGGGGGGGPVILGDSDPPDFVLFKGDIVEIGGR
jgi:hypothetical protein